MSGTLTFLHTSPAHIPTFDALLAAEGRGEITARHLVDEGLLAEACTHGAATPSVRQRAVAILLRAADGGAAAVLCTCSSIGEAADIADTCTDVPVLRVDRPMAQEAVRLGRRIVVVATLQSTLAPTRDLVRATAEAAGETVEIIGIRCETAYAKWAAGDADGSAAEIAETLQRAATMGDVVVLAQASMAKAAAGMSLPVPVLSSPHSGVAAAVAAYRESGLRAVHRTEYAGERTG